jgi:hypothetical protein
MIYIKSFSNYEDFKEIFGFVEHGNGVKSRKNKILLGALKDRRFVHYCLTDNINSRFLSIKDMTSLKSFVRDFIERESYSGKNELGFRLPSVAYVYSTMYRLDALRGLCEDLSVEHIRYVNTERRRVFKMKAGKFITNILNEHRATSVLPEHIKRWVGEEFSREWKAHATKNLQTMDGLTLHVGNSLSDFAIIYSSEHCVGDFGSCMVDDDQYYFYKNHIDASAAYLTNEDGYIVARCIIYNDVTVESSGETLRLAERQYTSEGDNVLKQILIDKLIAEGRIDGYKRIGASCHDSMDFVLNDGTPLREKMHISNDIDYGDTLSYQDTFKWLDIDSHTAYNYENRYSDIDLAITDSTFEENHEGMEYCQYDNEWYDEDCVVYDEYNEIYIHESHAVDAIYHGYDTRIGERDTDDFCWSEHHEAFIHEKECAYVKSEDDFYLLDEVVWSECMQEHILKSDSCTTLDNRICHNDDAVWSDYYKGWLYYDDAVWSDITEDYYLCDDDRLKDEAEYRRNHSLMLVSE